MANDVTTQPWIIDSTGVLTTDDIRIKHIRWDATAAAAGNAVILKDKNGRVVWESHATGSNYDEDSLSENQRFFPGLTVDRIDSGTVYIYLW